MPMWLLPGTTSQNHLTPSHRLLLAQIQVGFRKVKQYRDDDKYELSTLALTVITE